MRIKKSILMLFEALFCIVLFCIIGICISGTQHNIAWYKVSFVMVVILLAITFMIFILLKAEKWILKYQYQLLLFFCILWGVILYVFSCFIRNIPVHDYQVVYDSAVSFATGGEVNWVYFARWKNNLPLFALISGIAKISFIVGIEDPFYLILLVNVVMVIWTGVCVYELSKRATENVSFGWAGLLLFAAFIPCWGGTQYFYTDAMSLCFGIWAVRLILKNNRKKRHYVMAGVLWAVGYLIKATSAISMIAVFIIIMIFFNWRQWLRVILCILAGFMVITLGWQLGRRLYPSYELERECAAPVEYWIAIGLKGNGSYGENEDFAVECLNTSDADKRTSLARNLIKENLHELWNLNHLISKARYNFASGNMGLSDYNRYEVTPAYDFFNDYGRYGGYITMFTSSYLYALILFGALGSIFVAGDLWRGKAENNNLYYIIQLTLFGLIIILMIWEANNRQLYNHMPWFSLFAVLGCHKMVSMRKKK